MTDSFPPEATGGTARVALTQARALQRLGHKVSVLSTRRDDSFSLDSELDGIPVHRIRISYPLRWQPYLSLFNPIIAGQVAKFLRQVQPDIVHAHNVHAYLTYHSLRQVYHMGIPLALTIHDTMSITYQKFDEFIDPSHPEITENFDYRVSGWSQLRRQRFRYFPPRSLIIRRVLAESVDVMIFPSREMQIILTTNEVCARQMLHIPNGIDPAEFESTSEEREEFRRAYNLVGRRVILIAGRVNQAKGGRQILLALERVIASVPDALLLILSPPGGYGEAMLSVAETRGIRQYIRFAGWLSGNDLGHAFGAADVLVTPSIYFDNFPTVNLEAMAAGTPVIATCFGGSRESVLDGRMGFIVNPYDVEMLSARLIYILTDDALRARMGQQAYERVRANYDWLVQARKLVDLYQDLRASK